MFSRIKKEGSYVFGPGIRSTYDYDYASLSDTMNDAYCTQLHRKLEDWQKQHGKFNVVVGIETEGIRIGYRLAQMMNLPFYIMPHKRTELEQLGVPSLPADTHWLIVDDIVTTGTHFMNAVDQLEIEEKPESITYACMIKRNPQQPRLLRRGREPRQGAAMGAHRTLRLHRQTPRRPLLRTGVSFSLYSSFKINIILGFLLDCERR